MEFQVTEKEKYILIRRRKKIKLKQLAEDIGCSIKLISLYENDSAGMSPDKIQRYKKYIDKY